MGGGCSKSNTVKKSEGSGGEEVKIEDVKPEEPYQIFDPEQYDQAAIKYLKDVFRNDTETFILNQLLMCTMFFNDYTDDIRHCTTAVPENERLIREHQKELILPDSIIKTVCQRFKYQPLDGPHRNQVLPLISQRMYIIHNNIEIEHQRNNSNYALIDKPSYQGKIEESKTHKGFVKVHLLSPTETRFLKSITIECEATPSTSASAALNDSGFSTETDNEYATVTAAKTPQKLNVKHENSDANVLKLPSKCYLQVRSQNINVFDSDSDEDDDKSSGSIKVPSLFLINTYLNSYEFMEHFKDTVFPRHLGEVLNFPVPFVENATSIAGSIFCKDIDQYNNTINYEIIPAIAISWPDEIAFEWPLRSRVTVYDKRTGTSYQWPTNKMIDEAKQLKCVLIPRGFLPKCGNNAEKEIEWEIGFPKAERYLELRMTQAQMRIFLILLILHRTLIEPKTKQQGLLVEHIRHFMFWECEANYKDWPQDKLGVKLQQVLKNLYNYLSERKLPHYFIKERNVLENVPNKYVLETLEDIMKVMHSPVAHLLTALKDVKYHSPLKFYPEMDLDELHKIIHLEMVYDFNIQVSIMSYNQTKQKQNDDNIKRDKEYEWNRRYLEAQRQKNALKIIKKGLPSTTSTPSDPKVPIQKRFQNDTARQIRLLAFFIQHFVKIAKRSLKVSSTNQTLLYSKQAWYLTKLLEHTDGEVALQFQQQIKEIEDNCQKKKVMEPKVPVIPRKNTYSTKDAAQAKNKKGHSEGLYLKAGSSPKKKEKRAQILEPKVNFVTPVQNLPKPHHTRSMSISEDSKTNGEIECTSL